MTLLNALPHILADEEYLISEPHYEIGKSIHADRFYYAKKYFQSTDNSNTVALSLSQRILSQFKHLENHTFVGYGNFSALFLSKLVEKIKLDRPEIKHLNYALIEKDKDDFSFSYNQGLNGQIIVVMPITRTAERYFKLRDFISKNYPDKEVSSTFFIVFLILEESVYKSLKGGLNNVDFNTLGDINTKNFYQTFKWQTLNESEVFFSSEEDLTGANKAIYLDCYPSKLYLVENCPLCFPETFGKNSSDKSYREERTLILTPPNHDTLNTIFGLPPFAEKKGDDEKRRRFHEVFEKRTKEPIHLYGHIKVHGESYLNFIQRDIFYLNNKLDIIDFFKNKLNDFQEKISNQHFVIITPGHFKSSGFLEDLIASGAFGDNQVSIIPYDPFREYLENFIIQYYNLIKKATKLIYFDDVVAGGKTFKLISDFLKNARNELGKNNEVLDVGFDFVLTLIDRSTNYNKEEIKRKLATVHNPTATGLFIAYFKLNVPQIDPTHIGSPIKELHDSLVEIFKVSHLDALKLFTTKEIFKGAPKKISTIIKQYKKEDNLRYFPFIEDVPTYLYYKDRYNFEQRNLIKLHLFHKISAWIANEGKFGQFELVRLIKDLTARISLNFFFNITSLEEDDASRKEEIEIDIIGETIIKILSRPPFQDYKDIHDVVLNYNNDELYQILEKIYALHQTGIQGTDAKMLSKRRRIIFDHFRRFKTLIKRSIELNSNFIISNYFLRRVKDVFINEEWVLKFYENKVGELNPNEDYEKRIILNYDYQRDQLIKFKYFLLHGYKQLIFKNPARSIILEKLLNSDNLQPKGLSNLSGDDTATLNKIITDSYYQLWRILKSENIYLINALQQYQIHKNEFVESVLKSEYLPPAGKIIEWRTILSILRALLSNNNPAETHSFLMELDKDETFKFDITEIFKNHHLKSIEKSEQIKESIIKTWFFYRYFQSARLEDDFTRQVRAFLSESKVEWKIDRNNQIISSVLSMLYTVVLLNNKQNTTHSRRTNPYEEDSFVHEIKKLLAATTSIMGTDLEYAFFIEYKERNNGSENIADNVFTIVSKETTEDRNISLNHKGLIYNMLYGLEDYKNGNVQTFIAIAKSDKGEILSLKDDYYSVASPDIDSFGEHNGLNEQKIVVKDALEHDYLNGNVGLKLIERSNMILLFRLADIKTNYIDTGNIKGQAVLALCSTKPATPKSFFEFASVEKMRLLLLIKEEMLAYLQKHFESDAFIAVLEDHAIFEFMGQLDHGLGHYRTALTAYELITREILDKGEEITPEEFIIVSKNAAKMTLVVNAIIGQINAGRRIDKGIMTVNVEDFRSHINMILEDDFLGNNQLDMRKIKIDTKFPNKIYKCLYEVVIPELVINMKKHSPLKSEGNPFIQIYFDIDTSTFTFKNKRRNTNNSLKKKLNGGITMCSGIVEKLGLLPLKAQPDSTGEYFEVTLNLNANDN